ncbi:protein of unknown function DUF523 [Desulfovibrio sp. X2]|uniref:DUF523 domain-containing protein n=1 Tax=Desulfovibrio sp. X2 TaxID=941449 RepID=UPI00035879BB|nr:DUF523 domain-containing protein [Desulfovibrio sp. X2]EPR43729.1 protein of unknown function DUF523 [Desulfovibrio sp. X2]
MQPLLVMSACLAGRRTRYDGRPVYAARLVEYLARDFEILALCPEVAAGLPVPREPINLSGTPFSPLMIGVATGTDYTFRVTGRILEMVEALAGRNPAAFVLKSRSPTCAAVTPIPVYDRVGPSPDKRESREIGRSLGLFARQVRRRFPGVPVADERVLADSAALESFARVALARAQAPAETAPAPDSSPKERP